RVMLCYVLPNVTATIIVIATIGLGGFILVESALSFLGFGVPPPYPSWGAMLSGSGRSFFYSAPSMAIWPGTAISLAVFGFNMLGDALRDVLDPRLRRPRALASSRRIPEGREDHDERSGFHSTRCLEGGRPRERNQRARPSDASPCPDPTTGRSLPHQRGRP